MRATTSNVPLETDHLDERVHNHQINDALFIAASHRLQAAKSHLEPMRPFDAETSRIADRLDEVAARLQEARHRTDAFFETGPYSRTSAQAIHDLMLKLADCAENLVRQFESPGPREDSLGCIEDRLDQFDPLFNEISQKEEIPAS